MLLWATGIFVALWVCVFKSSPLSGHQEELRAIEALSALRYPEQNAKARPACTDKGYKVVEFFGGFPPASFNAVSVKANPKFSDVEMVRESAEGKARIHVRLVRDNGWKFDDVYLNQIKGKECNQWASYICEHPIAFTLQFHADDVATFSKNALDTTKDILQVIQQIKQLSESEQRD